MDAPRLGWFRYETLPHCLNYSGIDVQSAL